MVVVQIPEHLYPIRWAIASWDDDDDDDDETPY
jgi:hypothetical protein